MVYVDGVGRSGVGIVARMLARLGFEKKVAIPHGLASWVEGPKSPLMYALEKKCATAVALIGSSGYDVVTAACILRERRHTVLSCRSLADVGSANTLDSHWSSFKLTHILVDVDGLGGISVIYSELRRIRDTIPELAVILVSSEFSADDFSLERLPLCDACLRARFTADGLDFAMTESADVNNKVWQTRLEELQMIAVNSADRGANIVPIRPVLI